MGFAFYFCGIVIAALLLALGIRAWYLKNKDAIFTWVLGNTCYTVAKSRGYIKPREYEADRIALDYAMKHKKNPNWKVID